MEIDVVHAYTVHLGLQLEDSESGENEVIKGERQGEIAKSSPK